MLSIFYLLIGPLNPDICSPLSPLGPGGPLKPCGPGAPGEPLKEEIGSQKSVENKKTQIKTLNFQFYCLL